MLAGSEKVLEKRFDSPEKSWNFLSLKVREPCFINAFDVVPCFRKAIYQKCNRSEVETLHLSRVWWEVDAHCQIFAFGQSCAEDYSDEGTPCFVHKDVTTQ